MSTDLTVEQQISAEIERLRGQFPNTQDLYREACVLLFFRFGITPTANKLYQLVRKGSMAAPAEALARFWDDLREKSRVRIEHPDLPEALRNAAGDLTAALWLKAQELASESLKAFREESQAAVLEATTAQSTTETKYREAVNELDALRQVANDSTVRIQELQQRLAAAQATEASLQEQLERGKEHHTRLQEAVAEARREFSTELEKLRASATLAEERSRSHEERALMEIDRERTLGNAARKELETLRGSMTSVAERHRVEVTGLQEQIAQLRQRVGQLEGYLQAESSAKQNVVTELSQLRDALADMTAIASESKKAAEYWRDKAKEIPTITSRNKASRSTATGKRLPPKFAKPALRQKSR